MSQTTGGSHGLLAAGMPSLLLAEALQRGGGYGWGWAWFWIIIAIVFLFFIVGFGWPGPWGYGRRGPYDDVDRRV